MPAPAVSADKKRFLSQFYRITLNVIFNHGEKFGVDGNYSFLVSFTDYFKK
jgi:hypothetical protein